MSTKIEFGNLKEPTSLRRNPKENLGGLGSLRREHSGTSDSSHVEFYLTSMSLVRRSYPPTVNLGTARIEMIHYA